MKLKIVVHTGLTEEGDFKPGDMPDIREGTAEEWIKRGWAIPQPEEEKAPQKKAIEIETPEDSLPPRETATIKRKKK